MSYIKAEYVLPQELLELIQQYIDGDYIYIPRKTVTVKVGAKLQIQKQAPNYAMPKFTPVI
jgi:hypothetical protein